MWETGRLPCRTGGPYWNHMAGRTRCKLQLTILVAVARVAWRHRHPCLRMTPRGIGHLPSNRSATRSCSVHPIGSSPPQARMVTTGPRSSCTMWSSYIRILTRSSLRLWRTRRESTRNSSGRRSSTRWPCLIENPQEFVFQM